MSQRRFHLLAFESPQEERTGPVKRMQTPGFAANARGQKTLALVVGYLSGAAMVSLPYKWWRTKRPAAEIRGATTSLRNANTRPAI